MGRNFKVEAVHKKTYPATHNFKDEVDGTEGDDLSFIDVYDEDGAPYIKVIALKDGHRKVLEFYNDNVSTNTDLENNFTAQTDGTIEWWFQYDGVGEKFYFQLWDPSNTIAITIRLQANTLNYYDLLNDAQLIKIIAPDTWYHFRLKFDCGTDRFDLWIDGVQEVTTGEFRNVVASIDTLYLWARNGEGVNYEWMDAVGFSWDTDYNVGDNVHWRHYKESKADTFEEDDVGTQGTSITWVDSVDTAASVEIIAEYNEHKKILRQDYTSAAGGYDYCQHTFATQAKAGWFAFWIKASDITGGNHIRFNEDATLISAFAIRTNQFQKYSGGAWSQVDGSPVPVNDTWYLIYLKITDAATDTVDCWIGNILYETYNAQANETAGVNNMQVRSYGAGEYVYIDAPISSLDGDSRGDNRLLDYHATYTKEDITDNVLNATYENKYGLYRKGVLYSNTKYEKTVLFLQLYDINSKLTMEAEIKDRIWNGAVWQYPLMDKNLNDLKNRSSNTFSANKIHDPTDSTCMLKTIIPTVGQVDGRLILVNADTKTDTYSPVAHNKPDGMMLSIIGDIADSNVIIEANGKIHLDDDLASGSSLDVDTAAHQDYMTGPPIVNDILEDFNYYEIFGAINPDTGERFYKIVDNTGSDEKHPFRITNNQWESQADVDAYAVKIAARTIDVKNIYIGLQGMGTHDMGTTFTYKYVDTEFNIPSAAYYVVSEKMNMDMATSELVLSSGIIEESKYAADYERPQNYSDSYAGQIYETDIVTVYPSIQADTGSGASLDSDGYVALAGLDQRMRFAAYIDSEVDTTRDMTLTMAWKRIDNTGDTLDFQAYILGHPTDGGVGSNTILNDTTVLPACSINRWQHIVYTLPNAQLDSTDLLDAWFNLSENLREIRIKTVSLKYYVKR